MKIRPRIALWMTLTGVLASSALSLYVFIELIREPFELVDQELAAHAESLVRNIDLLQEVSSGAGPRLHTPYWVRITAGADRVVYASDLANTVELGPPKAQERYTVDTVLKLNQFSIGPNEDEPASFRMLQYRFSDEDTTYLVLIGRPVENLRHESIELVSTIGGGLMASALVLVVVSYTVSGWILRPITKINEVARQFGEKDLHTRIPLGRERDEIFELSSSMNAMFERLQFSLLRQKEFIANASHELKTPITLLRLSLDELFHGQAVPDSLKSSLERLHNTVLGMDRLVKKLLSLSALELSGRLDREIFELNELADSVVEDFRPIIEQHHIAFVDQTRQRLEVWADKEKVKRVLINLVENSVKYTQDNGEIRLALCRGQGKDEVIIRLANTGCGIPAEAVGRVFDQFYRVEQSRSAAFGGTGLGLTLCKKIVEMHGGTITVDSEPGSWTRFQVVLPILKG